MKYKLTDAPGLIKDADPKTGVVTGYFAAFGNKDSDGDIIRPGAFAKTIAENGPGSIQPRIKHLLDHRTNQSIGKILTLKEDEKGLYYESQIGTHALGVDFLKMAESGLISEHSIGYSVIKGNYDKTADAYELLELKLYEGSSLQFYGANPNTPLTGMKSEADLLHYFHLIEEQLQKGTLTDDTFKILQKHYDAIGIALKSTGLNPDFYKGLSTTDKKDKAFLIDMIAHHRMALDMAEKVSESERLKTFAQKLIKNQSAEIDQMGKWLKDWFDATSDGMKSSKTTEPESSTQPDALKAADLVATHLKITL